MTRPAALHVTCAIVALAVSLAAVLAVTVGLGPPVQPAAVFLFLLLGPGTACLPLLPFDGVVEQVAAVVLVSAATGVVVAQALLYAGVWSPMLCMLVLCGITVVLAQAQLLAAVRDRRLSATEREDPSS